MDKEDALKDVSEGSDKAKEVDRLLKGWEDKHLLRFWVTGPAFFLAFLGMMLNGSI